MPKYRSIFLIIGVLWISFKIYRKNRKCRSVGIPADSYGMVDTVIGCHIIVYRCYMVSIGRLINTSHCL